jgi:hypothetical protein
VNPALLPKFFVISSVILLLTGVAQVFVRPRQKGESIAHKIVNRATITAVISVGIGILGLLLGLGIIPMPKF